MNKLEFSLPSSIDMVCKVDNIIENVFNEFGLMEPLRGKITLALIEAVSNSILFGNEQNAQKMVKITAHNGKGKVIITVEDEGKGFDYKNIPDPTTPENIMKENGRGVYLIKKLTDELFFKKNGAKIIMVFPTKPEQPTVCNHGK